MSRASQLLLIVVFFAFSNRVRAANRYWVATTASNWNNPANWSNNSGGAGGAGVPTTNDAVTFNLNGAGNCTIDIAVSIKSITVSFGYPGTITQGANTFTTSGTASFSDGTFAGGSANITFGDNFTLTLGTFISTSAILEFDGNSAFTLGTFNANGGTVRYVATGGNTTISGISPTFYILDFVGEGYNYNITSTGAIKVTNSLDLSGSQSYQLNTGTIDVLGNIYLTNTATTDGGSGTITIDGTGSQTFDGTAITIGQSLLPAVTIDKTGGTLSLKGNISESKNWQYTAGAVDASTFSSTVAFGGNNLTVTSAGMSFYNVSVTGNTITLANSLTATGNLGITAGSLAPAANTINLAGNWSDYGTAGFTEATSTVVLNGSTLQTISAPGGETFSSLVIDNSGTGIELLSNTTAGASLTMTSGNINLDGNTLTTGLSAASSGALSRSGGTIINTGTLTRWFKAAAISGTTGLFPVGTTSNYRPFIVTTTANPTGGGTISMSYNDAASNSAVAIPDGASTIFIRKDLNWAVSTANSLTGGTYDLQIQGTGFGQVGQVSDLRISLANSVVGTAGVNGGTTADPQVNRTGLSLTNLKNSFYIGSVNPGFTSLPLDLLYFNGFPDNGQVILNWATPSDNDAVLFIIQRSKDGSAWTDWQRKAADSMDAVTHDYSVTDPSPYPGTSFYRLQQVDARGNSLYSPVLAITQRSSSGSITIYPIPATDELTVSLPRAGNYLIGLFNVLGQPVRPALTSTGASVSWQVSGLPAGPYFVRILHDGVTETKTVLIKL